MEYDPELLRFLVFETDDDARFDKACEFVGIPIRHPHTAMGGRLVDFLRIGRSVQPVGRLGQCDKDRADRIIRSRRQFEFLFIVALNEIFVGIVVIDWIEGDALDLVGS